MAKEEKKVVQQLESGMSPDKMDLTSAPITWGFVSGMGAEGITPFEYEIVDKTVGDEVLTHLEQADILAKFEHLALFIQKHIKTRPSFYLKVRITHITAPTSREIMNDSSKGMSKLCQKPEKMRDCRIFDITCLSELP